MFYVYVIMLTKLHVLTPKEMRVCCKSCIAVCFNGILV